MSDWLNTAPPKKLVSAKPWLIVKRDAIIAKNNRQEQLAAKSTVASVCIESMYTFRRITEQQPQGSLPQLASAQQGSASDPLLPKQRGRSPLSATRAPPTTSRPPAKSPSTSPPRPAAATPTARAPSVDRLQPSASSRETSPAAQVRKQQNPPGIGSSTSRHMISSGGGRLASSKQGESSKPGSVSAGSGDTIAMHYCSAHRHEHPLFHFDIMPNKPDKYYVHCRASRAAEANRRKPDQKASFTCQGCRKAGVKPADSQLVENLDLKRTGGRNLRSLCQRCVQQVEESDKNHTREEDMLCACYNSRHLKPLKDFSNGKDSWLCQQCWNSRNGNKGALQK